MALKPGSIAFVGFNADGADNLAFVALDPIQAGTVIFFQDNEWDGAAFNSGESIWSWTATTDLAAGTVIRIDTINGAAPTDITTNVGTVAFVDSGNRGISTGDEIVYAYLGTDANTPTTFLAAIASVSLTSGASLAGTGLTEGVNALSLGVTGGADIAAFNGARAGQASFDDYGPLINNPANWIVQDASGDQSVDTIAPDLPFAADPFTSTAPAFSLSNYVRVGRFDLPEPTRTTAPANSVLAQEVSAVTYNWDTDTLFVVGDGGTSIVQISKTGALIDSMTLAQGSSPQGTAFYDPEGLAYVGGGKFVMAEERDRQAVQFTYKSGTTLTRADAQTVKLGTTIGNVGFEGLTYDPATDGFIFVKEAQPQSIFQTNIDFAAGTATNGSPTAVSSTDLFNPASTNLLDFADVYALSNVTVLTGLAASSRLIVLSQESARIVEVDRSSTIFSALNIVTDPGNPLSVVNQQHEGVAMDADGNLYVVSENGGGDFAHPQLWVYAPSSVPNQAPVSLTLLNQVTSILENTGTAARIKVADVTIADDGLGPNDLSLSGADTASFEVDNTGLYIKAGTKLDFETKSSFSVTVVVVDSTAGATPDATANFTLSVTDILNEAGGPPSLYISEVAPWSSGNSPVAHDWFEVTNAGSSTVDLAGWKVDDNSDAFASAVALSGIASIAPGESVIFMETADLATDQATFISNWFGANPPAGFRIGAYSGSSIGLSTGGDHVNLFDSTGALQAAIAFGPSSASPFQSFNNAGGLNNATVTTLSVVGTNGAFIAANSAVEIGSPGTVGRLSITEVAPWSSGSSPVAADWFEATNNTAFAINITGWKVDDSSGSPAAAVALNGITSIAAGESVIFVETANLPAARTAFLNNWFGGTPPAGLQIGGYTGAGIGLGSGGDAVHLYDANSVLKASLTFGASPDGPYATFDNTAGQNAVTISQLSTVGTNNAFVAANSATETGSPGAVKPLAAIGDGTDETFISTPSADTIDGGAGTDVVVLNGARLAAQLTRNGDGSWSVTTAAGGTDTVRNVELLQFADGRLDIRGSQATAPVSLLSSGDVDQDSAVLIAKASRAGNVTFQVATDAAFTTLLVNQSVSVADATVPAKLRLADGTLTAGVAYHWRAIGPDGDIETASFRSADLATVRNGFSMGVTGDWRGEVAPYPAIKNAATADLDLFIKLGDTIYAVYPTPAVNKPQAETLAEYRLKHAEVYTPAGGIDPWGALHATTAILAMIDDHEVINDFAGGAQAASDPRLNTATGLVNDAPLYENGLQAFVEYNAIEDRTWANTGIAPLTDGEKQLYRYSIQGQDAAVIMLDARSFRDQELAPVADLTNPTQVGTFLAQSFNPTRTMLGAAQIDQLKADLLDAQSKGILWKFVNVPEPIQNFGVLGAEDRFEGYAAERTELLKFIRTEGITGVVFVAADIHGTVVNNLTYQEALGGAQTAVAAWEITTGSVAFDAPFGQTVAGIAAAVGLINAGQKAFYDSLPVAPDIDSALNDKDDFLESLINQQVGALGYDPVGLDANLGQANGLISAQLVSGDYLVTHNYGWTQFDVDATSGALTVTTFGVPYYSAADAAANPTAIAALTPTVMSQFTVDPTLNTTITGTSENNSLTGTSGNNTVAALDGDDTINAGPGNDTIDGGAGSDTAVFAYARSAASIMRSGPGAWTVTTPGGISTLSNVEILKFTDSSLHTTSQTPYLVPSQSNVHFVSLLSAGDVAGVKADGVTPYRMVGVPDGLGAFDNGNGTITVLMNHEIGPAAGVIRETGQLGSFVSKLIVDKATLSIVSASDATTQAFTWNTTTQAYEPATTAFARFCSGDLAEVSAFYNAATGLGTQDRIYLNGEEFGVEGRPVAHILTGADAGKAFELPKIGNAGWENLLANPHTGDKTVVVGTDDTTGGQVYVYVGTKQATGTTIDKAGLTNGALYGIKADFLTEGETGTPLSGNFTLAVLPDETNRTGADVQADSVAAGVTGWLRPEDGAWDTIDPNRFYFVTTASFTGPSRLWALDFEDPTDPTRGGTFTALLDGTEGQKMMDNMSVSPDGTLVIQEDVGNQARSSRTWHYDPKTDTLTEIARHDSARFGNDTTPLPAVPPFTQDEESSGVIDVTSLLGSATQRAFLVDTQAHYPFTGPNATEVVEGGQLQVMLIDTAITGNAADNSLSGTFINETVDGGAGSDTMVYNVARAAATINQIGANSWTVTTPGGGTDTLTSVEMLQFTDRTIATPYTLQILHFYGESGMLGVQTAPILGAMVDKFRTTTANTLVLAEGDTWIPGPWLVGGADPSLNAVAGIGSTALARPDVAILNALGVNASALGNHEFDLGSPVVSGAIAASGAWVGAQFPFITSNLNFAADNSLRGLADASLGGTATNAFAGKEASTIKGKIAPYTVVTLNGEKIGIVGATTYDLLTKTSPNGTVPKDDGDLSTSDLEEVAAYIQTSVDALKAVGVNKIVLVDQLDTVTRNQALAPLVSGIDVMVAGGGHERLGDANDVAVGFNGHDASFQDTYPLLATDKDGNPTLIVTTDTEFSYLGRLQVQFDAAGVIDTTALNALTNGAYAANQSTLQTVYSTNQTAAQIIAGSTTGTAVQAITNAINTVVTAKDGTKFGFSNVFLEGDRVFGRAQETNLGDLTADANAAAAKTALGGGVSAVVSLKNGGGLRASIGSIDEDGAKIANPIASGATGNVSLLDIENALRFDNRLMVFDTTAQGLLNILNYAAGLAAGNGGFPQVGGIRYSYDPDFAAGARVVNVGLYDEVGHFVAAIVQNGVVVAGAPATIPVVILNFTANGGDGYPVKANGTNFRYLLTDGTLSAAIDPTLDFTAGANVPVNSLGEQKAMQDFLLAKHGTQATAYNQADTPAALDLRIENLNVVTTDAVIPCFAAGTLIATARGSVAVEDLRIGDLLPVIDNATLRPIVWIGHRHVDCRRHPNPRAVWPIRVAAGAFGKGLPARDLMLSPDHAIYSEGVLIPVKHLVNGTTVVQVEVDEVTYFHVELPRHDVIRAEGLPVESYLDSGDRNNFTNGNGTIRLFADFSGDAAQPWLWEASGYAPLRIVGMEVEATRRLLTKRAATVGRARRQRARKAS